MDEAEADVPGSLSFSAQYRTKPHSTSLRKRSMR
jgi:hypothetical protein